MKEAFIFDLNGTMVDDMEFHLDAWHNMISVDLGAKLSREEVRQQMYGRNDELLTRVFGEGHFSTEQMDAISMKKERRYQAVYRDHLVLIPGLEHFLNSARQRGIKMAIGSAAIPFNIDFVIDNLNIRHYFSTVVSATDVVHSKPHPETYLKAAEQLNTPPSSCLVFEDSPKGVETALNAGMNCIVITTLHTPDEFTGYNNILFFIQDYHDERLYDIFNEEELN